ncbi:putative acyltransferase YihG [Vibrio aerogenes CECT 7868]|uniref:Putative acyltransferase YihG n=1 Tax=Vibrio aerogenes CECT 7868 TaxID=1216006 RepID=A0A1M6EPC9_9VIBR|nr:acyltransferase [Vibrio aerogenes]SHI87344.1 putative acyltransferase YihG [Vibrio aerogenes CECT 7868]
MLAYPLLLINLFLVLLNTAFCSVMICLTAVVKLVLPSKELKLYATKLANLMMWLWATLNLKILSLSNHVEWDIQGGETLHKDGWYLMISNHISWADIVVLCSVFKDKIPMPKFFLKYQLLYIPFIGMSCWALDMPFMRRYSRGYLIRHPEKRGQDLETTRRSCTKFKHIPTTVVNYVEGTRFTPDKKTNQPEYEFLLSPKSGGIAYTLAAMGALFENIIDVTLAYPDNLETPFKDMLMGKMKRIIVHIDILPVDEQVRGDYFNDKPYKRQFQKWLSNVWAQKDQRLKKIYRRVDE